MGPIVILDKSTFQSLSKREHSYLDIHFLENLTPILGMEILADLQKEAPGSETAEEIVSKLAEKFSGSGPATNVDYRTLCAQSLLGYHIPLTGQIVPQSARPVHTRDGTSGIVIDLSPLNHAILRWQDGKFEEFEQELAGYWRKVTQNLDFDSFCDQLNSKHIILPKVSNFRELRETVDSLLATVAYEDVWLSWLLGQLSLPKPLESIILVRRKIRQSWLLKDFSTYAWHCLRALLMLLVGTRHKLLHWEPTNLLDVQYLYYLPFCMVFASNDRLHRNLAPLLIREDQSFVNGEELKADLRRLADFYEKLNNTKLKKLRYALASYPLPKRDSVVHQLWKKHMRPWRPGRGSILTSLSKTECEEAIRWAEKMFREVEGDSYFE